MKKIGIKLLWTGLTIIVALSEFLPHPILRMHGAVLMVIGLIMYLFNR